MQRSSNDSSESSHVAHGTLRSPSSHQIRGPLDEGARASASTLAPVHRLPRELLSIICDYTIPYDWFIVDSGSRAIVFAQVCRLWRMIALASPWIWARISLGMRDLQKRPYRDDGWKEILETYAQRSGDYPLGLKLWPTRGIWGPVTGATVWEFVARNSHRLRALHVRLQGTLPDPRLLPQSLPVLTTLYLGGQLSHDGRKAVLPLRSIAPVLRTLGLYHFPLSYVDVEWGNLRALIMPVGFFELNEVIPVLCRCARLEVLEIILHCVGHQDYAYNGSYVDLPFLRKLETLGPALLLLPFLRAPLLRTAFSDLMQSPVEFWARPSLASRLCILPALEKYTLKDVVDFSHEIRCILRDLTHLRHLRSIQTGSVGFTCCCCNLLRALEVSDAVPVLLPALVELEVEGEGARGFKWCPEDEEVIRRVVESRMPPAVGPGISNLQRLRIWAPDATFSGAFLDWLLGLQERGVTVGFMDSQQIFNSS
ncbi:hypothetical protein HDZ31DRAFT_41659 [Schizophyllum fasciatum]